MIVKIEKENDIYRVIVRVETGCGDSWFMSDMDQPVGEILDRAEEEADKLESLQDGIIE